MPVLTSRAFKVCAFALTAVVTATYLYLVFTYRSANIFAPPERIGSLGRTYLISNFPPRSREGLDQQYSSGLHEHYTLERVSTFPLVRSVYQWQNAQIRGQATSGAYLEWGDGYISYSLSGGP
ncbi:hypothetical protein [Rhodococcus sp. ARC_M6]|uniref:hypothetical protein n=1 Tax=Rhodococcus sp. ARC_M6 TaxID=2928852 RepID=UPI001FB54732|nr:hypothetical protein [Rhodococcus sp. ARC_M6]MCJ0906275.1 hypothetical protein [Rhodococcus sp. ARC_M6]